MSDRCFNFPEVPERKKKLINKQLCLKCLLRHGEKCKYHKRCFYCTKITHHCSMCPEKIEIKWDTKTTDHRKERRNESARKSHKTRRDPRNKSFLQTCFSPPSTVKSSPFNAMYGPEVFLDNKWIGRRFQVEDTVNRFNFKLDVYIKGKELEKGFDKEILQTYPNSFVGHFFA
ncbi:hypothetical protein CRE_08590 [Caenorhabditis remanei]|uniref:Uncharacterized protein n=1 Tax=Caenorhabditis remanei TaxID=31234 RepID=E3NIJ0_CAERE|nr:hypothetical protein CRE_08590 [Caenorhabditis remanei]